MKRKESVHPSVPSVQKEDTAMALHSGVYLAKSVVFVPVEILYFTSAKIVRVSFFSCFSFYGEKKSLSP